MNGNRFRTAQEIKMLLSEWKAGKSGGPLLRLEHGKLYVYDGESHALVVGSTGSGKSYCCSQILMRILALSGESMIIADPKGELARRHRLPLKKLGYKIVTINLKDLNDRWRSGWNPLLYPCKLYRTRDPANAGYAYDLVENLAFSILPDETGKDAFWINSARSIFMGCCYALFEIAPLEQVTVESVFHMVTDGSQRFAASTYLAELAALLPSDSPAAMQLATFTSCSASDTRAGMVSTLLTALAIFSRSEQLIEMLSYDEVDIARMDGSVKTAIFIIFPDSTSTYDALAGVAIQSITQHLIHVADKNPDGKLSIRHNIIIEELGSIGKAIDLPNLFMAGRSRNLRLFCVLQSLMSLDALYGADQAQAIRSSADLLICMRLNNLRTMQEISELCGEREVECGPNQYTRMPLIRPAELQQFETGQALIMLKGKKFMVELPTVDEIFPDHDLQTVSEPPMDKTAVRVPFFDIKVWVREAKHKEMAKLIREDKKDGEKSCIMPQPFSPVFLSHPDTAPKPAPSAEKASVPVPSAEKVPELLDIDVDEMIEEIDKRLRELKEEAANTIKNMTGQVSVVLRSDQTATKPNVVKALCSILKLPMTTAQEYRPKVPVVLLQSLTPSVAKRIKGKLMESGINVELKTDAEVVQVNRLTDKYRVMLINQSRKPIVEALSQIGFSRKEAVEISKSLPCVIFDRLQFKTAQHIMKLLTNADVSAVIDHDEDDDEGGDDVPDGCV